MRVSGAFSVDVGRAAVGLKTGLSFRRLAPRLESGFRTVEHVTIHRMEHVGLVVDGLAAATEFFVQLGLVLQGDLDEAVSEPVGEMSRPRLLQKAP